MSASGIKAKSISTFTEEHPRKTWHAKPRVSRKEARRQDRVVRKQQKAGFFSTGMTRNKRLAEEDHVESPKRKKAKYSNVNPAIQSARPVTHPSLALNLLETPIRSVAPRTSKPSEKEKRPPRKQLAEARPQIRIPRTHKEEEEDLYIKYLEAKLKRGRCGFEDDGLDGK